MAIKMRFLYYSGKAKMKAMAEIVKKEFELSQNYNAIDIIPPAYGSENERLVILAVSGKGEPDDVLRRFCFELTKKNANNVALLVDGDEKRGCFLAGQISGMVNKEQPAKEMIEEIFAQAEDILNGAAKWVR